MTAKLVLIRHGQTSEHAGRAPETMSGVTDTPLSNAGRSQIALLAARLRREKTNFAAVWSSPLQRATETARAILDCSDGPLKIANGLQEIDCGRVDGLPIRVVQSRYAASWEANLRQDDENFRWPGGESYREFRSRCLAAIEKISAEHPGQCVAVVTHAGVISQVLGTLRGFSAAQWEPCRPGNASLCTVAWREGSGELLTFDDRSHLQP